MIVNHCSFYCVDTIENFLMHPKHWKVQALEGASIGRCKHWKVQALEGASIGRCKHWKVQALESASIGRCKHWKVQALEGASIGRCKHWKVQANIPSKCWKRKHRKNKDYAHYPKKSSHPTRLISQHTAIAGTLELVDFLTKYRA